MRKTGTVSVVLALIISAHVFGATSIDLSQAKIVVLSPRNKILSNAADMLGDEIEKRTRLSLDIVTDMPKEDKAAIIIGTARDLPKPPAGLRLPQKADAYAIWADNSKAVRVYLAGYDDRGALYAAGVCDKFHLLNPADAYLINDVTSGAEFHEGQVIQYGNLRGPLVSANDISKQVVYPDKEWVKISPEQAGFDVKKLNEVLVGSNIRGGSWGGVKTGPSDWGAVLTRGGYLVKTWGNPEYKCQSASLGKNFTWLLVGLAVDDGLIRLDDLVCKTWTGEGQLSGPHKYLNQGHHKTLTWRHLLEHQSGFVLESGYHWRNKTVFHANIPEGVMWTGDPLFDNYAHNPPGSVTRYSSGAYWRLGQALTALWGKDLKEVLDERVFRHMGIPADRWQWLAGKEVHDTNDFYPDIPKYGEYIGPPYEINGHIVRGGPGWVIMSAEDLARFGLLISTRGIWKDKRLVSPYFLPNLQYGVGIHAFAGDPETMVSYARINTKGFPFGGRGFHFPKELIAGPVAGPQVPAAAKQTAETKPEVVCEESLPNYSIIHETKIPVPMQDGINLGAEIYRPDAPGKFPAIMVHRYFLEGSKQAKFFAKRGYVVALIDCRGRGDSEGKWVSYVNEPQDGYDAQQWLGSQPWCNGKVGTFGISYNGFTQLMAAPLNSPYLKCLFPEESQQTNFGHLYNDGVMQLNVVFEFGLFTRGKLDTQKSFDIRSPHYQRLPLIGAVDDFAHSDDIQHLKDWFKHCKYDDYWKGYGVKEKYSKIKVPAYFTTGWYDNLVHETWRNFKGFREQSGADQARKFTRILVGPGTHGSSGSYPQMMTTKLRWYDYWLKGKQNGIDKEPPIQIYVMGADKWRYENEWPLARTRFTKFYLHSGGNANSSSGDGVLSISPTAKNSPSDKFVYDPLNPVFTLGGQISTHSDIWGARDRGSVQKRRDVLVYTTEPLTEDMEVTGPVELKLYAASTAVDTDFTATLTDVHPDGKAIHICEGICGARFRKSLENPTLIEPGRLYEYTISLWETSMVFKAGHRIRLEVSSSNFPRYARNQNTGLAFGMSAEIKKAEQTIYHDGWYSSQLILPVIPQETNQP